MVRVIMDDTGSGKTKQLIDLANAAVKTEHGNVICIEPKSELTYDIDYNIRLIAANDYELPSYEAFKGFLSGMYAGNYDITHVFVDNLTKIIRDNNETQVERFLDWLDAFSEKNRSFLVLFPSVNEGSSATRKVSDCPFSGCPVIRASTSPIVTFSTRCRNIPSAVTSLPVTMPVAGESDVTCGIRRTMWTPFF